ncbi:WYL domain-containing protein [Halobacillus massiliensis]|uniref:WYL domain-containing protein n=1 Tax=Halobacillus massiliensis TaxID=1926286 RepID=UPI0009E4C605|nr:WYL domain-containing protein [Halobacillus massiliensis]
MEALLKRSADSKERLEMIYLSHDSTLSQRTVRVLNVYEARVVAYCFLRKEVRTFSKDRILSVFPTKNHQKRLLSS